MRFIGEGLEDLKALYQEAGFALTEGEDYDLLISLVPDPELRRAVERGLPFITTREGAWWSLKAILRARESGLRVQSLQDWHQKAPRGRVLEPSRPQAPRPPCTIGPNEAGHRHRPGHGRPRAHQGPPGAGLPVHQARLHGGFLREGNTTLLIGLEDEKVPEVLELIKEKCRTRTRLVSRGLPFAEAPDPFLAQPVEVQVGGAVVFVLPVEHFVKL